MTEEKRKKRQRGRVKVDAKKINPEPNHKSAVIACRVSAEERREMADMARKLGVSLSEYLRQLHRQAVASLKRGRGKCNG